MYFSIIVKTLNDTSKYLRKHQITNEDFKASCSILLLSHIKVFIYTWRLNKSKIR